MATLLIHAIECVAVSDSELTPDARAAINTTIDFAATVATSAGPYGAVVAGALQAGKAIFNAVKNIGAGPDQLYLSLSNVQREKKIWPQLSEFYEVKSGQRITELSTQSFKVPFPFPMEATVPMVGPLKIDFINSIDVNFWDHDSSPDDFLGRLAVSEADVGRMKSQVVGNVDEGSLYLVAYSVEAPRWSSMGGFFTSDLAAVNTLDSQLAVFGRGDDHAIWWKRQINANALWEPNWNRLGAPSVGAVSAPSVALDADGAINLFVQGGDNAIWHRWQLGRNSTQWSDWVSRGGNVTSAPAAVLAKNRCLAVFARGTDETVQYTWQVRNDGEWNTAWKSLGGRIIGAPAVTLDANQLLVVAARGADNAAWIKQQTQAYIPPRRGAVLVGGRGLFGTWSDQWASLGGFITSAPSICQNADGGLAVFARGGDNSAWTRQQTAPNSAWEAGWNSLYGTLIGAVASVLNTDGRLEIFSTGTDRATWNRWQVSRNGLWF